MEEPRPQTRGRWWYFPVLFLVKTRYVADTFHVDVVKAAPPRTR